MALLLLVVLNAPYVYRSFSLHNSPIDPITFVSKVHEAQQEERASASEQIYHVKKLIKEGKDKPRFVEYLEEEYIYSTERVDAVQTWQHQNNALVLISSNATEKSFESYLSVEDAGEIQLYHYGPEDREFSESRVAYDSVHDLAVLYKTFTTTESPSVSLLPEEATLLSIDQEQGVAHFSYDLNSSITIEAIVGIESKQVTEEFAYVTNEAGQRYEILQIEYLDRKVLPIEEFDFVFDPKRFAYELIEAE